MEIYYFKTNKLKSLLPQKVYVDETPRHERLKIADQMVEEYCHKCELKSQDSNELLIAIKLLLFKYYLNNITSLYSIVRNNKLNDKNIIIIRFGFRNLYRFEGVREIVLPGKYNILGALSIAAIFFKYITKALWGFFLKNHNNELIDVLILPEGNGKLEKELWSEVKKYLNCSYSFKKYPRIMLKKSYQFFFQNDKVLEKFRSELKRYDKKLPFLLVKLIEFQFYNTYQFILLNPSNMVVSFEQSSPYSAILAYIARLMGRVSIDIAHGPTFGENYKHTPSKYNLVHGINSKKSFERRDSIVCGRVIPIGSPKSDVSFKKPIKNKSWNNDILFLPNYTIHRRDFEQIKTFEVIQRFIEKYPEINLTVKPHPARENPYIKKYLSHYANVHLLKVNVELLEQIDIHDITIICGWSAAGLEVVIREKPLIRLNLIKIDDWFGYTRFGYSMDADNLDELCEVFSKIRKNPEINITAKNKILNEHFTNHGFAGKAIGAFLDNIKLKNRPYHKNEYF